MFRCLPHDADTAQGFHPSFCVVDELHVHKDRRMLDAMLTGMAGRDEPLLIVITTAGEQRRGVWWEVLKEWREDPSAHVYWVGASDDEDARDPAVWRAANPASWVSEARLAKLYRSLPLASFERYHLNRAPAHGANRVFEPERWRACSARPAFDPERPCVLGVDASQRRDHTAVVLDQMDSEGRHNVVCFAFAAEEEGEIMSAIDTDAVGELIRELCASYNVVRIPCDRAYNVRLMGQLLAEGLPIEEFAQSDQNMTRACQRLFDAVAEERVLSRRRRGARGVRLEHSREGGPHGRLSLHQARCRGEDRRRHRPGHGSRRGRGRVGPAAWHRGVGLLIVHSGGASAECENPRAALAFRAGARSGSSAETSSLWSSSSRRSRSSAP